jgi:hypothetical protein
MTTIERTQNTHTAEQIAELEIIVNKHNEGKNFIDNYFIVDLTGEEQVFFTLYRYAKPISGYSNPYKYVKNLSTNIVKAVEEILTRSHNVPVIVHYAENNNPLLTGFRKRTKEGVPQMHFGKYKGMTVAEIWDKDRNWIIWFNKEYKTKPYADFFGKMRQPVWSAEETIMKEQSKQLVDLFWEDWREKKIEENLASFSEFIGELKIRIEANFIVDKVIKRDDYTMVYLKDANGNVAYIYGNDDLEVGETYALKGTPTKHIEKLGLKTTYLNRVSIKGKVQLSTTTLNKC